MLFALGSVYPVRQTRVPTIAEVEWLMGGLWFIGALVLGRWALGQFRRPLPEAGPRPWLLTIGLYWVCMCSVLLNPLFFAWPIVPQIAAVTPDQEFAEEYAFHEQYGFLTCNEVITQETVDRHRDRIRKTLEKYGLSNQFQYRRYCYQLCGLRDLSSLYTLDLFDREVVIGLGVVLGSIAAAKATGSAQRTYYERFVTWIFDAMIASALFALLLAAGASSPTALSRWFAMTNRLGRRVSTPKPRLINILDRHLRTTVPVVWAVGLHKSVLLAAILAALTTAFVVILALFFPRSLDIDPHPQGVCMFLWFFLLPIFWVLWSSRKPAFEKTVGRNQIALALEFISAFLVMMGLCFPILPTAMEYFYHREGMIGFPLVICCAALALAAYGLLARCISAPRLFMSMAIGAFGVYAVSPRYSFEGKQFLMVFFLFSACGS